MVKTSSGGGDKEGWSRADLMPSTATFFQSNSVALPLLREMSLAYAVVSSFPVVSIYYNP